MAIGDPSQENVDGYFTEMGLLAKADLVSRDGRSDEAQVFFCPVNTQIVLDQGTGIVAGATWMGPDFGSGATRNGYSQNPVWRWGEDPRSAAGPRPWVWAKWYYQANGDRSIDGTPAPANQNLASRPFIPKIKDWKGFAIVGDLVVNETTTKQGHKGGINMLYPNWNAQWIPVAMLQPEWDQVNWPSTFGVGYSGAYDVAIQRVWKKIGLQSQ
jgi:hypothetical protein